MSMINNEMLLEKSGYDNWKLNNRDDELTRRRVGLGGKWGTVEYEYIVENLGKCPCCEEDILGDCLFVEDEDGTLYHLSCFNYKKKEEISKGR